MILHQLAELVDAGRDQLEDPKSVSRGTAEIIAGAVYGTVLTKIKRGWPAWGRDFLPELMYMAVLPYLGAPRRRAGAGDVAAAIAPGVQSQPRIGES